MSNLCLVMTGPNKFKKENRQIPVVDADDVLVHMEYVGICGSDVHLFQTGKQGENIAKDPMILGHEAAGVVAEVGKNVRHLETGDKVALEPGVVCGQSESGKSTRRMVTSGRPRS